MADFYVMKSSIFHRKKSHIFMGNFQLSLPNLLQNLCFVFASSGNWFLTSVSVGPIEKPVTNTEAGRVCMPYEQVASKDISVFEKF